MYTAVEKKVRKTDSTTPFPTVNNISFTQNVLKIMKMWGVRVHHRNTKRVTSYNMKYFPNRDTTTWRLSGKREIKFSNSLLNNFYTV